MIMDDCYLTMKWNVSSATSEVQTTNRFDARFVKTQKYWKIYRKIQNLNVDLLCVLVGPKTQGTPYLSLTHACISLISGLELWLAVAAN